MATPASRRLRQPARTSSLHASTPPDIVTLTHLRWDFVFQRPQHLLTRCARLHRVFVVEEPLFDHGPARYEVAIRQQGVHVVVPRLPENLTRETAATLQASLLRRFFLEYGITDYVLWYY